MRRSVEPSNNNTPESDQLEQRTHRRNSPVDDEQGEHRARSRKPTGNQPSRETVSGSTDSECANTAQSGSVEKLLAPKKKTAGANQQLNLNVNRLLTLSSMIKTVNIDGDVCDPRENLTKQNASCS